MENSSERERIESVVRALESGRYSKRRMIDLANIAEKFLKLSLSYKRGRTFR